MTEESIEADDQAGDGVRFLIHSFDRDPRDLRWSVELPAGGDLPQVHRKNNMATPSCVTDGDGVFCWFATGQLIALGLEGSKLLEKALGASYNSFQIA